MSPCDREMINIGPKDGGDNLGDFERKKVDLGIDNALDQSFFCLYGLNLKCGLDTSNEDDLTIHRNMSLGDYQTKESCDDVFATICKGLFSEYTDVQSLCCLVIYAFNPSFFQYLGKN